MNRLTLALSCALLSAGSLLAQDGLPAGSQPASPDPAATPAPQDPTVRTGTYRTRAKPRTHVVNSNELGRLELLPVQGASYTYEGQTTDRRFEVSKITLVDPATNTTTVFTRFSGPATVTKRAAHLEITHDGETRTLLENPYSQIEARLEISLREHPGASGTYRIRGWAIDTDDNCGKIQRTLVVDGVEVHVEGEGGPKVATAFYGMRDRKVVTRKGKGQLKWGKNAAVVTETDATVQYSYKAKYVTLLRSEPSTGIAGGLSSD